MIWNLFIWNPLIWNAEHRSTKSEARRLISWQAYGRGSVLPAMWNHSRLSKLTRRWSLNASRNMNARSNLLTPFPTFAIYQIMIPFCEMPVLTKRTPLKYLVDFLHCLAGTFKHDYAKCQLCGITVISQHLRHVVRPLPSSAEFLKAHSFPFCRFNRPPSFHPPLNPSTPQSIYPQ